METTASDALLDLLRPDRLTCVVDIGANPIDSDPPYKEMLARGLCTITGFEPQAEALAALNGRRGQKERYLPDVIGDGTEQTLHVCQAGGMTSLLQPDPMRLALFNDFAQLGHVERTIRVATKRLDEVGEIEIMDFLKMDVQGAELQIIDSGQRKLSDAIAVQTEVSFVPLYRDQPPFGEIDMALRKLGFIPHCLAELKKWPIAPAVVDGNPRKPLRQILEADLVYVRDFSTVDNMRPEQWKHLAMVAHHCYGSIDLALRCIMAGAQTGALKPGAPEQYLKILQSQKKPPAPR